MIYRAVGGGTIEVVRILHDAMEVRRHLLREYHDHEYGAHRKDDAALFELLCLEMFCN